MKHESPLDPAKRISLYNSYHALGDTILHSNTIDIPTDLRYQARHPFLATRKLDVVIVPGEEFVNVSLSQQDGPAHISHDYTLPRDPEALGMVHERRAYGLHDYLASQDIIRLGRYALLDHIRLDLESQLTDQLAQSEAQELATISV